MLAKDVVICSFIAAEPQVTFSFPFLSALTQRQVITLNNRYHDASAISPKVS